MYDVIEVLRKRPEMFLGSRTLTGLFHYLSGYRSALHSVGVELDLEDPPFREFHQWIQQRLNGKPSVGWLQNLLEAMGDETSAFEHFWLELDEFRQRGPKR